MGWDTYPTRGVEKEGQGFEEKARRSAIGSQAWQATEFKAAVSN
jgi:hypothetical protein